jgi:hypothetical protein
MLKGVQRFSKHCSYQLQARLCMPIFCTFWKNARYITNPENGKCICLRKRWVPSKIRRGSSHKVQLHNELHLRKHKHKHVPRRLSGVVVSVLATGLKGRGFKPGRGDGFLRAIKIRSTPSFGWEVKPKFPCRKILLHVKDILKSHGDE